MPTRNGKVAIVAGASRGAGRGIALALGDAGATVYVVGRTTRGGTKPADGAPGTIEETAEAVTRRGGVGIPIRADCTAESDVAALFDRVRSEQGRLDVLANAVWGAADAGSSVEEMMAAWGKPFWQLPPGQWQNMMSAGPYAYFLTGWHAANLMTAQGLGLIVGVTDGVIPGANADGIMPGADPDTYVGQLIWDLAHQCINRLLRGMAREVKSHGVAVVTLMPGFMRTERVLAAMKTEELKKTFGFEKSESTEYLGRAVAALAADGDVLKKTGKIHFVGDLAREYGFTDVDGRSPPAFNPMG